MKVVRRSAFRDVTVLHIQGDTSKVVGIAELLACTVAKLARPKHGRAVGSRSPAACAPLRSRNRIQCALDNQPFDPHCRNLRHHCRLRRKVVAASPPRERQTLLADQFVAVSIGVGFASMY